MAKRDLSSLKRPIHPMSEAVREALLEHALMEAYRSRPAYQQNDYIGWINAAKRDATKRRRLEQMLDELESGDRYMKMAYRARARGAGA